MIHELDSIPSSKYKEAQRGYIKRKTFIGERGERLYFFRLRYPTYESKVLVVQSCLTLCDPVDCSPPGSFVHGSLQARILKLQYFGQLMQRVNSLEKTLMVGKIEGRRRRG